MLEQSAPFARAHEPCRLPCTRRQVFARIKCCPILGGELVLELVTAGFMNLLEGDAIRIAARGPTDGSVPAVVVPGDALSKVPHAPPCATSRTPPATSSW